MPEGQENITENQKELVAKEIRVKIGEEFKPYTSDNWHIHATATEERKRLAETGKIDVEANGQCRVVLELEDGEIPIEFSFTDNPTSPLDPDNINTILPFHPEQGYKITSDDYNPEKRSAKVSSIEPVGVTEGGTVYVYSDLRDGTTKFPENLELMLTINKQNYVAKRYDNEDPDSLNMYFFHPVDFGSPTEFPEGDRIGLYSGGWMIGVKNGDPIDKVSAKFIQLPGAQKSS